MGHHGPRVRSSLCPSPDAANLRPILKRIALNGLSAPPATCYGSRTTAQNLRIDGRDSAERPKKRIACFG